MDSFIVAGLPAHVLIVHLAVVAVPVLALALVVAAAWPAARRVLWTPLLVLAALSVALVAVAQEAGEWLEERVPEAPLIEQHADLGETVLPWTIGLAAVTAMVAIWDRVEQVGSRRGGAPARGVRVTMGIVLTVLALVAGTGATVATVLAGDSGARAVWEGSFSETPLDD
ncbi:hypothetical protein [Agromyces sp. SYSU T00194]|uniref:hypothetical protein n=1 Tax=Agromyces chitinivorans TaxID=3158560 RepID=UPI003392C455